MVAVVDVCILMRHVGKGTGQTDYQCIVHCMPIKAGSMSHIDK